MLKELLEAILELKRPEVITNSKGDEYIMTGEYNMIKPQPLNDAFSCSTLDGIIEYISKDIDERGDKDISHTTTGRYIITIESPTTVTLRTGLTAKGDRGVLVCANAVVPDIRYGVYCESDEFIIKLMSEYEQTDDLKAMIQLASHIVKDSSVDVSDDGMSQRVTLKKGVASVKRAEIQNPFNLTPFRTFTEISQPESKFLFRIKDDGRCVLFKSGDTAWRNEAMSSIKAYLENAIEKLNAQTNPPKVDVIM